ncbi:MAG: M1 family aminopeptidase [Acidobacteria bacterium]|nr:M1 family aminopeptidase [Acidobacteriota bacterium]
MRRFTAAAVVLLAVLAQQGGTHAASPQAGPPDGVFRLLLKIEQVMQAGKPDAYLDLLSAVASRDFASDAARLLVTPDITRAVIRERDRTPLEGTLAGDGYRLMIEVFTERGTRARMATWRLDVRRVPTETSDDEWRVEGQKELNTLDGLFRLSLNPAKQFRARNLVVTSDDLEVRLAEGYVFVAETPDGPTAAVLVPVTGGSFRFRPAPETEREQVRIYAGTDTIDSPYQEVFFRFSPADFESRFAPGSLTPEPVDAAILRRAEAVFRDEIVKSYNVDLGDLSRDTWSLPPQPNDLLVELRTRRYQGLTYAKSGSESEDISLFDRHRRRNISVYSSAEKLAAGGRSFDEDENGVFDVDRYTLDVSFDPERQWIEGRALLDLRIKADAANNLTLHLAEPLTVQSVYSAEWGRLLSLRVRNQNSIVVNLPGYAVRDTKMSLVVVYAGRLAPVVPDRESVAPQFPSEQPQVIDTPSFTGEPSLLYTTRSFWYPQGSVSDYATATMHLTVPDPYQVLASGDLQAGSPVVVPSRDKEPAGRLYTYEATQPVRYLACLISRFGPAATRTVSLVDALAGLAASQGSAIPAGVVAAGSFNNEVELSVEANPRQLVKGRGTGAAADDLLRYYTSLIGDCPYPSLTVAPVEKDLPGGHSPAYLSVLNVPVATAALAWANDPAAFLNFPDFFVAHEVAHQWWGQAVGWRSYHDQWISEGFSQYFAALYARKSRGDALFFDLLRRMARWARDKGDAGPVDLGYRLGHIQGDSRIFRAIVYNKSAVVLHMLRRMIGDDAFFRGIRRFYFGSRFRKAGAEDVRLAMEAEGNQRLESFFDAWIHGSGTPRVRMTWRRDATSTPPVAVVRVEQVAKASVFPVTATVRYASGSAEDFQIVVRERVAEFRLPLTRAPRDITLNRDGLTPLVVLR